MDLYSQNERFIAGGSLFAVSSLGILFNFYIFKQLLNRTTLFNGFFILCLSKSISNGLICSLNLFWTSPAILMNSSNFSPHFLSTFLGQMNEYGLYMMGPFAQILMVIDRFLIIFFPMKFSDLKRSEIAKRYILISWIISFCFICLTFPNNCWAYFDVQILNYKVDNKPCDNISLTLLFLQCYVIAGISACLQVSSLIKLLSMIPSTSTSALNSRRKRTIRFFIQSFIQDCLNLLDLLNSKNYFNISNPLGKFYLYTFSLVFVQMLDGFIMCLFHIKSPFRKSTKIRLNSVPFRETDPTRF